MHVRLRWAGGLAASFAAACSSPAPTAGNASETSAPTPALAELYVAPLTLQPAFSPTTYDYVLPCATGTNTVNLSMVAIDGATAALTQPTSGAAAAQQAVAASLSPDQAAVIQVSAGGRTAEYWLRCLPPDFPQVSVTLYPDAGAPTPGWYLLGQAHDPGSTLGVFAMVLDTNGTPVWYHREDEPVLNVDLRGTNVVSYIVDAAPSGFSTGGATYETRDLSSGATADIAAVGMPTDVHELRTLLDGNSMVIASPLVGGVDLTGLTIDGTALGIGATVADCVLQEVDSTGALVWSWDALDHVDPVKESTYARIDTTNGVAVVDPFHCNSVDEATAALDGAQTGDLLVSAGHLDAVLLVSRSTGTIVWKLGGAPYSKDGARLLTLANDGGFYRQHDARFDAPSSITLFDDQSGMPGPARGLTLALDLAAGTATRTWQYQGTVVSEAMGSMRLDSSGDVVIGWGEASTGTRVMTELTAAGAPVLDMSFAQGDSYRAVKVPLAALDLETMRNSAGQ